MLPLQLISVLGVFLFVFVILFRQLWEIFCPLFLNRRLNAMDPFLLILSLSWALSLGLRGVIGLMGYLLDRPVENVIVFNAVLGFVGLILFLVRFPYLKNTLFGSPFFNSKFTLPEKMVFAVMVGVVSVYAYAAIVPWIEWDEMVEYGVFSKTYAMGYTYAKRLWFDSGFRLPARLAEILTAQDFYPVQDTYLARAVRLVSLIFCNIGIFSFLRLLGAKRFWALMGVLSIFVLMDLQKTAVTLKVDNLLMVFEISALLLVFLVLLSAASPEFHSLKPKRLLLTGLAFFFSALAFSTRMSGIYIFSFAAMIAMVVGLAAKGAIQKKIMFFLVLGGLAAVCAGLYLLNLRDFGSPFFIVSSARPYDQGEPAWSLAQWRRDFNLDLFPPVLNQIYLLFHMALGLGWIGRQFGLDFLPGTHLFSLRWVSPVLLAVFILPFFWRRRPEMKILGALFVGWFLLWSSGVHITRVFIAGSCLPLFLAVLISSLNKEVLSATQRKLQRLAQGFVAVPLFVFVPLHFIRMGDYPHDWKSLYSPKARYESNVRLFDGTVKVQDIAIKRLPTWEEAQRMSEALAQYPLVYVYSDYTLALNIYFDKGIFLVTPLGDKKKLDPRVQCYFGYFDVPYYRDNASVLKENFPKILYENDAFFLRCRA